MSLPFTKTLIKGEISYGFWNLTHKGISLVNSFFILNFLSIFQFGLYQLIISFSSIVISFLSGLFDNVVSNDLSRYLGDKRQDLAKKLLKEYAAFKIVLGLIGTAVVIFAANPVAQAYDKDIGSFIRIIALVVLIEAITSTQTIFFQATVSFSNVPAGAVGEFGKLFIIGGFWIFGAVGVKEVLYAHVGALAIAMFFMTIGFLREYRKLFSGVAVAKEKVLWGLVKEFGWILVVKYYIAQVSKNVRPWLIKFLVNTEAVGIFQLAYSLMSVAFSVFPTKALSMLVPREVGDPERASHIFYRSIKYGLILSIIFVAGGFFAVPAFVGWILPKYGVSMPLFRLMLLTIPIYAFYKVVRSFVIALREQKILLGRVILNSVISPVLLFVFLPLFGVMGAAAEDVLSYLVMTVSFYGQLSRKYRQFKISFRNFFIFDQYDRDFLKNIFRGLFTDTRRWLGKKVW